MNSSLVAVEQPIADDLLVVGHLLLAQGRADRLGVDRLLAEDAGLEGGLERLDLLPHQAEQVLVILDLVESLAEFLDAIEEPLDIPPPGQHELLLLDGRQAARPLEVLHVQREDGIELATGHVGVGRTDVAEDPLIELLVVDEEDIIHGRELGRLLVIEVLGPGVRPDPEDRQEGRGDERVDQAAHDNSSRWTTG